MTQMVFSDDPRIMALQASQQILAVAGTLDPESVMYANHVATAGVYATLATVPTDVVVKMDLLQLRHSVELRANNAALQDAVQKQVSDELGDPEAPAAEPVEEPAEEAAEKSNVTYLATRS